MLLPATGEEDPAREERWLAGNPDLLKELETLNGKPYPVVQVVGGGSQAEYLNQLTADALGKTVYAGPTEASAIGNIIVQMWGRGGIGSLDEARQIVGSSFPVKVFQPRS